MKVDNVVPKKKSNKKKKQVKKNKQNKNLNKNNLKKEDIKKTKEVKEEVKVENKNNKPKKEEVKELEVPNKDDTIVLKKEEIKEKKEKKKFILPIILTFLLIFSLVFIYYFTFSLKLELKGKSLETINLGSTYEEKYAYANYLGKDVSKDITVSGNVDTNKIGEYKVTYIIKEWLLERKIVRTVKVKDLEKPIITLNGEEKVSVCPGTKYIDEGAKALDNLDGDLTDEIEVQELSDKVIYTVKDKSGNIGILERTLIYEDLKAPTLELIGGSTYTIYQNNNFTDPGYKVSDNCDQSLEVKVTNNVKSSQIGTYDVIYEVTDSNNNKTTITRKVSVIKKYTPPKTTTQTTSKKGVIYLTFDDGPNNGTTNVILDVLKSEGVKATFFVTSNGPDSLIKREWDEGHTVALHTYTHNYKTVYSSVDAYFNDLNKIQNRVKKITGAESKIIRFPGGSSNTVSRNYQKGIMSKLVVEVRNRGYNYFDWNVDSNDAGGAASASAVYNNVIRGLSKNKMNVVLMHDVKTTTKNAIRDIIQYGKKNGYTFEAITPKTPMVIHSVNN